MVVASMKYVKDEEGKTRVEIKPPEKPIVAPKKPWVPTVGEDTRDLRDPEKIGKQRLAAAKRKKK